MWCSSTLCHINFSGLNGRRKERKEKLEFHSFSSLRLARFVRIGRSVSPNKKGWVNLKLCVLQLCREDPAIYYTCIYVSTALAHSLDTHKLYRSTFRFPLVPSVNVFRRASNSPPSPLLSLAVCVSGLAASWKIIPLPFVRSFVMCFGSIYITVLYRRRRRCFPSFVVALFYTSFLLPRSMYVAICTAALHICSTRFHWTGMKCAREWNAR